MRTIIVINPKGGCGKTTIATNIAGYFASRGKVTALADFDPQQSSLDWLAIRSPNRPTIQGINAVDDGLRGVKHGTDVLVIDGPAGTHGSHLTDLVRRADTVVVPVLPSPVDIFAANRFVDELLNTGKIKREQAKVGLVANRVRQSTLIARDLDSFLKGLNVPLVGTLREAQNYIRAFASGQAICEMPPYLVLPDIQQWQGITRWLHSKRSQP